MAEDEIQVLPKTSCALRNNKMAACDGYLKPKDGKVIVNYFGKDIAQGFGCDLGPDSQGKYQVWVVSQGNLYYLAGADSNKQALAIANNLNDSWDRIVAREKEDAEWPIL